MFFRRRAPPWLGRSCGLEATAPPVHMKTRACMVAARAQRSVARPALRRSRRSLSTAAAAPAEAEEKPGKLVPTLVAASGMATVASGIAYYVCNRFVQEKAFRDSLRAEHETVAKYVEEKLLPDYAPTSWAQQVRIEDDLALGEQDEQIAGLLVGAVNPGISPARPLDPPGIIGKNYFGRFLGVSAVEAASAAAAAAAANPDAAGAVHSSNASAAAAAASSLLHGGAGRGSATNMISNTEAIQAGPLEPIAPDDEGGDEPLSLTTMSRAEGVQRELEEHGGPDGARWCAATVEALVSAWGAAAPPQNAARLRVPVAAAQKYERALAEYLRVESGSAAESAAGASSLAVATTAPDVDGRCMIVLPETMQDGMFAEPAAEPSAIAATSPVRLAFLRVQEEYARAEADALDSSLRATLQHVQSGGGGGIALQRMTERRRLLTHKLAALDHEKREVKREARAAPAARTA